jgi:hypothetical protein
MNDFYNLITGGKLKKTSKKKVKPAKKTAKKKPVVMKKRKTSKKKPQQFDAVEEQNQVQQKQEDAAVEVDVDENLSHSSQCSDIYYCYMFNVQSENVNEAAFFKNLFAGFTQNWKFAVASKIFMLDNSSANGFIIDIPFSHGKYKAHALLKSLKSVTGDNLTYEGLAGLHINLLCARFPVFIQTYGIGQYTDFSVFQKLGTNKPITDAELKTIQMESDRKLEPSLIQESCAIPARQCILIEKVESSVSFKTWMRSKTNDDSFFWNNELPQSLFQLYSIIDTVKENFTHYDLHIGNIMICQLKEPVVMRYHYDDTSVIEFTTDFVVKIIDYGRCFFDIEGTSSTDIINLVCKLTNPCGPKCGSRKGFGSKYSGLSKYFINATVVNHSHDLRALNIVCSEIVKTGKPSFLGNFKPLIQYDARTAKPENNHYGTGHIAKGEFPNRIVNVTDAHSAFKQCMVMPFFLEENKKHYLQPTKGTLDIWLHSNQAMQFSFA